MLENIPKGVALCLRRICDSDEKFNKRSEEYQNYFIARDYKPNKVKKQFSEIKDYQGQKPENLKHKIIHFLCHTVQYNPLLPNLKNILRKHLYTSILYSDRNVKYFS